MVCSMPRTSAAGTGATGRAASSAVARRTHPPTALTANAKTTITVPRSISRWVVVRIYLSLNEPSRGQPAIPGSSIRQASTEVPPFFSSRCTGPITMCRSTAFTMS